MTKRLVAFDYLRVFALGLILACHFFRTVGNCTLVDLPLGGVGNVIFFAMSGWLLGLGSGRGGYGLSFLKHRLIRLAIPLWIFAIPYMASMVWRGHALSVKDVILNLFLLNWFDRLPGMTPYWFITAIAVFYVVLCLIMHIPTLKDRSNVRFRHAAIVLGVLVALQIALAVAGIRFGYILIMLAAALACFFWGRLFLEKMKTVSHYGILISLSLVAFLILWWLYNKAYILNGAPSGYWCALIVAVVISISILSVFKAANENKVVCYLSSISYEVYLVHSALLLNLSGRLTSNLLFAVVFFALAIGGGAVLHMIGTRMTKLVEAKI